MTAAARNAFALQAAAAANRVHGVPVTFRGQEVRAILSPIAIGLDLETGGLRQGGEFRCRFLASSLASAPRRGEQIAFGGRTYMVMEVHQLPHSGTEHICTIAPGSRQ